MLSLRVFPVGSAFNNVIRFPTLKEDTAWQVALLSRNTNIIDVRGRKAICQNDARI